MSAAQKSHHGDFTWYELMTPDPAAARAFYGPLLGWSIDGDGEHAGYSVIRAGEIEVGGVLKLDEAMQQGGARPVWAPYFKVDDLGAAGEAVRRGGGQIVMEGRQAPGTGEFALAADPEGSPIYLMQYQSPSSGAGFAKYAPIPGTCAWNELTARDDKAALAFYTDLFGWRQEGEMAMGELGTYRFLQHHDYAVGAVMPASEAFPRIGWIFYFRVADIDLAATRLSEAGGTLLQEPSEIPGGEFSLVAADPEGAVFGLVGMRES